jgi:hypothetical protein
MRAEMDWTIALYRQAWTVDSESKSKIDKGHCVLTIFNDRVVVVVVGGGV